MNPTRTTTRLAALRRRLRAVPRDAGQATTELLMYSAVIVGVIVAIGAALQILGVDIIAKISTALGV